MTLRTGFKSKAEEVEWRRGKILELKSQGLEQREIANILQVTPALVSIDLQYLRDQARKNVHEYTTKLYPLQFKVALVAAQNTMRQFWNISQNAQDNKEKMQALEYYRQAHMDMMAMLRDGGFDIEYHITKEERSRYGNVKAHYIYQGDKINEQQHNRA